MRAALVLSEQPKFDITVMSERSYFEYHAALYRTSAGHSPLEVAQPLEDIFAHRPEVEVVKDRALKLNTAKKTVSGESGSIYKYDKLILALGSVTQYFGIEGLPEHSFGIKSVDEALEFRRHLHEDLTDQLHADRNYVVVGGGPTGVELAGEMVQYLGSIRRCHGVEKEFQVSLVEAAPRILPNMPERFSRKVEERLLELGVKIYTNTLVKGETADKLQLPEGNIDTHTVVWTAGVANNPFFVSHSQTFKLGKGGRVKVDKNFKAAKDVYVIGDSAESEFGGMAETALRQGEYVAKHLLGSREEYVPKQPVSAVPVGHKWCATMVGSRQLYGYSGWLLRRSADLKLYSKVLPGDKALRAWLYGNKQEEVCAVCAR